VHSRSISRLQLDPLDKLQEIQSIKSFTSHLKPHPKQINRFSESDSEIIQLEDGSYVAINIDTLSEEMALGFYSQPETIGWIAVQASLSDLAAVGADPIGCLQSLVLPPPSKLSQEVVLKICDSMEKALRSHNTFLMGGDTGSGDQLAITVVSFGSISRSHKPMMRKGLKEGDIVYTTRLPGDGLRFCLSWLLKVGDKNAEEKMFRPVARFKESKIIKEHASCCIDSSDGFLNAIDLLGRINLCSIKVEPELKDLLSNQNQDFISKHKLSPWLLLSGEHGDFELVFGISPENEKEFHQKCVKENVQMIRVGVAEVGSGIELKNLTNNFVNYDASIIRNLLHEATESGHWDQYIESFMKEGQKLGLC